jgi:hypothetical protein
MFGKIYWGWHTCGEDEKVVWWGVFTPTRYLWCGHRNLTPERVFLGSAVSQPSGKSGEVTGDLTGA